MSTFQRLTLIGLYNYENSIGGDLFVNLSLPEGYDKPTFINSLLLEHGEKCVLYSDVDFLKSAIGIWSSKWENELKRIYDALTAEYNPIWNYDRNEEYTTTDKPDNTVTRTNRYDVVEEQNVDSISENQISADNSSTYQPDNKNTSNFGKNTTSNDGTITDTEKGTRTNIEHDGHTWGNIGVTTSSQMVEQETALRVKNNLYSITTGLFANELLLGIW